MPMSLEGDARNPGYQKRKIAVVHVPEQQEEGNYLAFRLTIVGEVDNARGEQPEMRDFFLEGFAINPTSDNERLEPKKCTIF